MRVVLKKDRPLTLPLSGNSQVTSRIRRKVRAHCREVKKAFGDDDSAPTCSICIEPIEDVLDTEVTACGHVFHKDCLHSFRKAKVMDAMEAVRSEAVNDDNELQSRLITGRKMAEILVGYDAGFNCPNCRCSNPLIHQLAKRTVRRPRPYELGGMRLILSATDVLALVTRS